MDITEILAKFNLTVEQIDFDYSGMSAEEIESEIQNRQFGLTGQQLVDGLYAALDSLGTITMHDYWDDSDYEMPQYGYVDYDMSQNTVIAYDRKDNYTLYGFTYSINGDNVVIDAESKKKKRIDYVDFDEGTTGSFSFKDIAAAEVGPAIKAYGKCASDKFAAERDELNGKIESYAAEVEKLNGTVSELTEYKNGVIAAQRKADTDALFAQFNDLNGIEAFDSLRENCGEMELSEIEEKCFAIRGRASTKFALNESNKAPRLPVGSFNSDDTSEKPYGGLVEKYRNRNSR